MKQPVTTIYGLINSETREIRYVGKTCYLLSRRFREHLKQAHKSNSHYHVHRWMRKLASEGGKVEPIVLEIIQADDDWEVAERWWISYMRSLGARLTNTTLGGGGACGHTYDFTEEHRKKISVANKGKIRSEEARANYRRAKANVSDETRRKISLANMGKKMPPGAIAKTLATKRRNKELAAAGAA